VVYTAFSPEMVLGGYHKSDNQADQSFLLLSELDPGDGGYRRLFARWWESDDDPDQLPRVNFGSVDR
jgi:hypothetical protein